MGIDRMILTCISLVLIIFITVTAVELVIPISKNQIFNQECRSYLLKMERNGGLLENEISDLERRLLNRGMINVSIYAPPLGQIKFGETMTLSVVASYPFRLGAAGWIISNQLQQFIYKKNVFCRRIELG